METVLFHRSLISLHFLDEGGICADDTATAMTLLEAGCQLGKAMVLQH